MYFYLFTGCYYSICVILNDKNIIVPCSVNKCEYLPFKDLKIFLLDRQKDT